jgi:hypothetical protein
MRMLFRLRGSRLAIATAAIFAVAGGIAYAAIPDAGGVYHACLSKNGSIRIIDPDTDQCRANEAAITFNQKGDKGDPGAQGAQGPAGTNGTNGTNGAPGRPGADGKDGTNGTNGVSPTVEQLDPGNPHCLNGGVAITDAAGTTAYACSGQNGTNGTNGTNGQPFSGTFTSPSGEYSISVTDTGVTIAQANGSRIALAGDDISIRSKGAMALESGLNINVRGGNNITVESASNFTLRGSGTGTVESSGSLALKGSSVSINDNGSTCLRVARLGDSVFTTSGNQGAFSNGVITSGSPTVCIGG